MFSHEEAEYRRLCTIHLRDVELARPTFTLLSLISTKVRSAAATYLAGVALRSGGFTAVRIIQKHARRYVIKVIAERKLERQARLDSGELEDFESYRELDDGNQYEEESEVIFPGEWGYNDPRYEFDHYNPSGNLPW